MNSKTYTLPNGKKAVFEYDVCGIGKVTLECMDELMAMIADRPQEWIPCSEKLPELGEYVLATVLMFDDYRDIGIYTRQWTSDHSEIRWFSDDEYGQLFDCDVVAWMPLPEPYKEGVGE